MSWDSRSLHVKGGLFVGLRDRQPKQQWTCQSKKQQLKSAMSSWVSISSFAHMAGNVILVYLWQGLLRSVKLPRLLDLDSKRGEYYLKPTLSDPSALWSKQSVKHTPDAFRLEEALLFQILLGRGRVWHTGFHRGTWSLLGWICQGTASHHSVLPTPILPIQSSCPARRFLWNCNGVV